jgi:hypothetical protein
MDVFDYDPGLTTVTRWVSKIFWFADDVAAVWNELVEGLDTFSPIIPLGRG